MRKFLLLPLLIIPLIMLSGCGDDAITMEKKYGNGTIALLSGNYQQAFKIFKPLAEQGHADAQYWIGWMYFNGAGVEENPKKGYKWMSRAAKQGHDAAENLVAVINDMAS